MMELFCELKQLSVSLTRDFFHSIRFKVNKDW